MKALEPTLRTLDQVIDAVTDSYRLERVIDNLETTALPNRRKVIDAMSELEHVMYMGFYSTRELSPGNLHEHIGGHLRRAAVILTEQISRAIGYRGGRCSQVPGDLEWSAQVVVDTFARIPDIRAQLALDVQAGFDGDPAAKSIEEVVFSYPAIIAITVYRFAHELHLRGVPMVPRILAEYAHGRTGIEIHPGAQIGKRFFIDHGTGVVIGETAQIGNNVKLYQGVTLGAISFALDEAGAFIREIKRHPTIEDDVTIYAGATILGGDTVIGRGSIIGANTWVTRSVPPGTRVIFSAVDGNGEGSQRVETRPPPPDK
jgi:serine O-acetyltransferase